MAIPTIINLIETRVKDTGDTITGNLVIEKSTYPSIALGNTTTGTRTNLQTWDNSSVLQCLLEAGNTDNRRGLFLKNSRSVAAVSNALALRDWIDGTYTEYKIYGEHNKDLIKEVCLPIEGGTINASSGDAPLYIKSGSASTWIGYKDSTNTTLGFLGMKSDGPAYYKDKAYKLLHDGNYNSYSPTLTGGGASGTWGISISGSAATLSTTLSVNKGGTGQTTARNAANAFMNALETGSSTPVDADYYISQYVNGGITTTTYHRRPMSALWSYINGKVGASYLKLSGGTLTGNVNFNSTVNSLMSFFSENVTSGTAAGGRKGFLIFGTTYGNDAAYLKTAGKLTLGDPGPQIMFGTSNTRTSGQRLSLIYTDHDTIASGNSLSLVSSETNAWFISPSMKVLTTLNNTGNYQQNGVTGRLASITSSSPSLKTSNKMLWAW